MKHIVCRLLLATASALAEDTVCSVAVEQARPGDKPIALRLDVRGGIIVNAIGRAVRFSRSPDEIDTSGLTLAGGKLTGELKFGIAADGYQAATNGVCQLAGVAVKTEPRPGTGSVARLVLDGENVINRDGKSKPPSWRMQVVYAVRDGQVFGAKAIPTGSLTDVACASYIKRSAIPCEDGQTAGTLELCVQPQDAASRQWCMRSDPRTSHWRSGDRQADAAEGWQGDRPVRHICWQCSLGNCPGGRGGDVQTDDSQCPRDWQVH